MKIRLILRRETWVLTLQGWSILLFFIITLFSLSFANLNSFLSLNSPVPADILVVEGWIPDDAIALSITEFKKGNYHQLITTGGPVDRGFYLVQYKNFANLAAATCVKLGIETDKVIPIPSENVIKNRTFASALALQDYIAQKQLNVKGINLYSYGPHTRRSWLIFQEVFKGKIPLGAIASIPTSYDQKAWWKSSEGFRVVIGEALAYLYVKVINWKA
jgi:hypothetical protein